MLERRFGPTGVDLPLVGQGTWMMEADDRRAVDAALRRGIELGMTHVDTAEMYGSGAVEEILGEALGGLRDRVFLASKVLPSNASRDGTIAACERSLRRLRTDRLDLYLLHWPGPHPLEQTIEAFEALVSDGKIRAWGVSNFDAERMQRVVELAGDGRVACNQVLYHLQERAIEHAVIPTCERLGVAVVGYSPFGSGQFPMPTSTGGTVLTEVAAAHDATPHQVALAFLTRAEGTFTIPKSSSPERVAQNAGGGELRLSAVEQARIDEAFPLGHPSRHLPMI